jgi:hypothetical protein
MPVIIYVLGKPMSPVWKKRWRNHCVLSRSWSKMQVHGEEADKGIKIVEWHVDSETGIMEFRWIDGFISDRTKMLVFSTLPRIIGHINPVLAKLAKAHINGFIVDGYCLRPLVFLI